MKSKHYGGGFNVGNYFMKHSHKKADHFVKVYYRRLLFPLKEQGWYQPIVIVGIVFLAGLVIFGGSQLYSQAQRSFAQLSGEASMTAELAVEPLATSSGGGISLYDSHEPQIDENNLPPLSLSPDNQLEHHVLDGQQEGVTTQLPQPARSPTRATPVINSINPNIGSSAGGETITNETPAAHSALVPYAID